MSSSERCWRPRAAPFLCAVVLTLGACEAGLEPLRPPPYEQPDAGLRYGCPVLGDPQAQPGENIGGDDWESFARPFFESYCTRCHSTERVGREERNSAPDGLNWDDEASVRANLERIRNAVGVSNFMPPDDPKPSCEERHRLVRWIDAAAP